MNKEPDTFNWSSLEAWLGKTEHSHDVIHPWPVQALSATLNRDSMPKTLPPLWHWLYTLPTPRTADLKVDGHGKLGGFLPPIPYPNRMWAGSSVEFIADFTMGETLTKHSEIISIERKSGRQAELCFVKVQHTLTGTLTGSQSGSQGDNPSGGKLIEVHDIVYKSAVKPSADSLATTAGKADRKASDLPVDLPVDVLVDYQESILADALLLFRYSALTFNSHRIHYDRDYCQQQEGYAGLVVHGPLQATLLLEAFWHFAPDLRIKQFAFRALKPVLDGSVLQLCIKAQSAHDYALWISDSTGQKTLQANIQTEVYS